MIEDIKIIIQARMTSTRLPGKVLMEIGKNLTCLEIILNRLLPLQHKNITIATTANIADDPIQILSKTFGIECFRGDEFDVLSRFTQIINKTSANTIIRLTGDCPYLDPKLILYGLKIFHTLEKPLKMVRLDVENTFPRGFDFEIFNKETFFKTTLLPDQSVIEHVTTNMYRSQSNNIDLINIPCIIKNANSSRFTLDTLDDLKMLKRLEKNYEASKLGWEEIVKIALTDHELRNINSFNKQKNI